jgi:hypothetical protein
MRRRGCKRFYFRNFCSGLIFCLKLPFPYLIQKSKERNGLANLKEDVLHGLNRYPGRYAKP